jgi:hypothetical protein
MSKHTVKELKKIIMNYKKENCPAVSRAKRDELLKIIEKLEIEVDQKKALPQDIKKVFKKNEKLELKKIGGKELLKYIDENIINDNVPGAGVNGYTSSRKSIKLLTNKIEELFPLAYINLKKYIDENYQNRTNLDDIDLTVYFDNSFLNKIKKKLIYINDFRSFIRALFYAINKKINFFYNHTGPKRKIIYDKIIIKPDDYNTKITI